MLSKNIILESVERPLSITKWQEILVNVFVIVLFIVINPIYALLLCAFLNFIDSKINFFIFSFMFSFSFGLLFLLKDYSLLENNADIIFYMSRFETINDVPWMELFKRFIFIPSGNEVLFWLYVKVVRTLLSDSQIFFVFFQYFISFILITYLGKYVHKNKFVIIVTCLLLLNYSILTIMFGALRQTLAILLVYMGILLFDKRKNNKITRIFIYSSILFHISMVPVIVFFELFMLTAKKNYKFDISNLYSKGMAIYIGFFLLCIIFLNLDFLILILRPFDLSDIIISYAKLSAKEVTTKASILNIIFNWFIYLMILSIWIRRKKLLNSDVFIATQYFIFTFLLNTITLPSILFRYNYYIELGGCILIGRLISNNYKLGFILLNLVFFQNIYLLNYSSEFHQRFYQRLYKGYTEPSYGLLKMISKYDNILRL